jgi:hypothetical protein
MVVLDWNGTLLASGLDRIGAIWISNVEIFRTSTPLSDGASWHVEKDVSEYSSLLRSPHNVTSIVTAYSGSINITATISFYETSQLFPEVSGPDTILSISSHTGSPWFTISDNGVRGNTSITLPENTLNVTLEVFATAHHCEETWFDGYVVPNPGCSGKDSFREIQVLLDGNLLGVIWPIPVIFTAGINQNLWETIPSVNALDIPPVRLVLTPFVWRLANGLPHTISFRIAGNTGYWLIDANILLSRDASSQVVTGGLTQYDIQDVSRETSVTIDWFQSKVTLTEDASRTLTIIGYTNTSKGAIFTTIRQTMSMNNIQTMTRTNLAGSALATGTVTTVITTKGPSIARNQSEIQSYSVGYSQPLISNKGLLISQVDERVERQYTVIQDGGSSTIMESDRVLAHSNGDTLESYSYANTTGDCYVHYISTTHGTLTSNVVNTKCA